MKPVLMRRQSRGLHQVSDVQRAASLLKIRASIYLLAYSALVISLFLPSKASQMTSQFGEQVKNWEPALSLHLQIFLSPISEWLNYQVCLSSLKPDEAMLGLPDECRSDMWRNIIYWLPITLTGWLFLGYPLLRRLRQLPMRRRVRYCALFTSAGGTVLLTNHLVRWATLYTGYYHMGSGGYFLMSAYLLLSLVILIDTITRDRGATGAAGSGIH